MRLPSMSLRQFDQHRQVDAANHFDAAAVHVFAEARRLGQPIVAIMCDIDMFKDINDRCGHDVGDIVLIDVAQIIRRSVGARLAVLGRQGGDEFAILLPGVDLEDATGIAEGLRQACEGRSAVRPDGAARVTLSSAISTSNTVISPFGSSWASC